MPMKTKIKHDGEVYQFCAIVERADGVSGQLYHCEDAHDDLVVWSDGYRVLMSDISASHWLMPVELADEEIY